MDYFSDRELGKTAPTVNEIDVSVWNGIVAILDRCIADNSFSKDFPEQCPKVSVNQLINLVANENTLIESYLITEAATLTEIGNKFQIRHFETDKQTITDNSHVDYLFFRMFSLIDLCIKKISEINKP